MYSSLSDTENFLKRTGSFSLRFRKTGDNSDLAGLVVDISYTADKAADNGALVQFITNEIDERKLKYRNGQIKIEKLNKRLQSTIGFSKFSVLDAERKKLNYDIQTYAREIDVLKKKRKELAPFGHMEVTTFAETFVGIAKSCLPKDMFDNLKQATHEAMDKVHNATKGSDNA